MGGGKGGRSPAVSGAHFSGGFGEPASPGQARDGRERGRTPCVGIGRRFSRPCGFVGARREVNICQHGHPGPAPPRAIRVQGGPGQAVDGREAQAPYLRLEQSFVSKQGQQDLASACRKRWLCDLGFLTQIDIPKVRFPARTLAMVAFGAC
jgi:hypothetical protein